MRAGSRENRRRFIQEDCVLSRLGLAGCDYERHSASSRRLPLRKRRKRRKWGRLFRALDMMTRATATDELLGQPVEDWFAAFVLKLLRSRVGRRKWHFLGTRRRRLCARHVRSIRKSPSGTKRDPGLSSSKRPHGRELAIDRVKRVISGIFSLASHASHRPRQLQQLQQPVLQPFRISLATPSNLRPTASLSTCIHTNAYYLIDSPASQVRHRRLAPASSLDLFIRLTSFWNAIYSADITKIHRPITLLLQKSLQS